MNPEIAEQLLYESEATLRLVDSLLDELQDAEPLLPEGSPGLHALQLEAALALEEISDLPDLLAAAAAQARAVLEALAQSRSVLERTALEKVPSGLDEERESPSAIEIRGGLERSLLLVDRIDAEGGASPVQQLLREEILDMIAGVRAQEITEQQLSYASSVLRDTESQLSVLLQRLSPRRSEVIPFPTTWAKS